MRPFDSVSSAAVLQLGCGAVLLYDIWDRRFAPCPPCTATSAIGATSGIALLVLHLMRPGCDAAVRICALAGLYASAVAGHTDPFASFAADTLLRWLLLWLAAGAGSSAAGRAALLAQLGWLYLGSLLHKDFDAYFVDAHAARSLLLTEIYDARDWWPWRLAVEVAASPWLGPALTRFAYVAEAGAGLVCVFIALAALGALVSRVCDAPRTVRAAHAAVQRVNAVALPLALLASAALHMGLALTVHLHFFPYVSLVLTLACWRAAVELEDDLECAMSTAGAADSHSPMARLLSPRSLLATMMAPLTLAMVLALLLALLPALPLGAFHAAVLTLRRGLRMHQQWTMFPFESDCAAFAARATVYVELADGTEIDLRNYVPGLFGAGASSSSALSKRLRTGRPWEDFARPPPAVERTSGVAGGYTSFRWRTFWGHVLNGLDLQNDEYSLSAAIAARAACEHACMLWQRAPREAPAPVAVRLYGVAYDLPRRRGQNVVELEAKRLAAGALDKLNMELAVEGDDDVSRPIAAERLMWRAEREEIGVWPRYVVVTELAALKCSAGCRASHIGHNVQGYTRLGEDIVKSHGASNALTPPPSPPPLHTTAESHISSAAFLSLYFSWLDAHADVQSSSHASIPKIDDIDGGDHSGDRGGDGSHDDIDNDRSVRQSAYAYADDGSDVHSMSIDWKISGSRHAFAPDAIDDAIDLTSNDKWQMRGDAASVRRARNLARTGVLASHASWEIEGSVASLRPYEARNTPVTLRHAAASWPSATLWSSLEYMRAAFGEAEWEVEAFGSDNPDHIFTLNWGVSFPSMRLVSVLDLWDADKTHDPPGGANMVISELDFIVRGEVRTLHNLMADFPFPFMFDAKRHAKSSLFMARSAYTQVRRACV
jgi:hypothetical protein